MENHAVSEISAREVIDGYPDADLLPLPPPRPNESVATYLDWNAGFGFGDTLLLFVLRETACCDRAEAGERLRRAISNLRAVLTRLESSAGPNDQ